VRDRREVHVRTERIAVAMLLALASCGPSGERARPQRSLESDLPPAQLTVKAQYHTYSQGAQNQLAPWISLVNTGAAPVPLQRVTVRYWFTSDGDQELHHWCDYAPLGCGNVTARFVRLAAPVPQADTYLELGFAPGAGDLAPGQATGELYQRISKSDWTAFDQANDHSYDGSHWALADAPRITVYVDGQLVSGAAPAGTDVDPGGDEITDAEYAAFVRANNELGFDLLKRLAAGGEANLVYSPASISFALGMAYVGAGGTTRTEMAQVLHSQLSQGQAATAFGRLASELATRDVAPYSGEFGNRKELRLRLADALWVQDGFAMQPTYLEALQTRFGAPAQLLDFAAAPDPSRRTINDWVAQATFDRIRDLLGPGTITSQTRFVLTNALYFKGSWATIFVPQYTRTAAFHPLSGPDTTAQMMSVGLKQRLVYAQGDGWQLVQLPYVGGKLHMAIVLPDAGRFAEIRDGLSAAWLAEADAAAGLPEVVLSIPRFRIEPEAFSLATLLGALGMEAAFDPARADFTGMSPVRPLAISDVIHKAYIAVDEAGTEAAAATAIIGVGATPDPPVYFTANRPFVFLIRDASGAVLFAGQVIQP
jgi:serpin B